MRAIREVQAIAAKEFGYALGTLLYGDRKRSLARARQAAMLVARRLPCAPSYPEIGKAFDRDHTTIVLGVRRAEKLEATESWYADAVARITRSVSARGARARKQTKRTEGSAFHGDKQ